VTPRTKLLLASVLTVLLLGGATGYGVVSYLGYNARQSAQSQVRTASVQSGQAAGARVVFRNTAAGAGYGLVASVPLAKPAGPRTMTDVACDRVYSTTKVSMCLRIDRGVVTTFSANLLDSRWRTERSWPLAGLPSRTRISADSKLIAFTAFVTGEAYATVGFSTATQIAAVGDGRKGKEYGNLEDFALTIDGTRVTAADRNFWGVTFTSDDNIFFATAATANHTWLVRGNLAARTLTSVRQTAECPSVSPDGTKIAYKKNVSTTATAYWGIAVLDLATGTETVLPEKRNVDDQPEWLDDGTLLYGLPRTAPGDSDIWSIGAGGGSAPVRFIQHAWSPSVVTP
jgi:hypothetical protein